MRPDCPSENEFLLLPATSWFTLKYVIVEHNGIQYLTAEEGSTLNIYQPLVTQPPQKNKRGDKYGQPTYPEEWNSISNINLARLDVSNQNDILDFVNRWGLLGLWNVKKFKEWAFPRNEKRLYEDKGKGDFFSEHYINPTFANLQSRFHYFRYREPLPAFIKAVQEFQLLETLLEGDADNKSDAQDLLNGYIMDCQPVTWYITKPKEKWVSHWQTPSLLHTCYLLRWMDLISIRDYKRCKHKTCKRIFIAGRPNEKYCSIRCKENAKRLRNYDKQKVRRSN